MTTHTPGPWKVASAEHNTQTIGPRRIVRLADTDVPQALAVARVYHRGELETDANARLIAAAPEVVAVLREVLDIIDHSWLTEAGRYQQIAIDHAPTMRALLARVEQEAPCTK